MADINVTRPEHGNPLANFLTQHWRPLALITVAIVVIAAGYAAYVIAGQHSKGKGMNALGDIIATKTGPERLTALESYLASAPSSVKAAVLLEIARTAQDQKAFDKAAKAWAELAAIAPEGTRELAILGQATALAYGGDKSQAVKILSDFLPKAPKAFQIVATRQLAVIAEEAQAWNEALAANQKLAQADGADAITKAYYEAKVAEIKSKIK